MLSVRDILMGLGVPAGIVAVLLALGWRVWERKREEGGWGYWSGGLGVALGAGVGMWLVLVVPRFPPVEVEYWVVYACAALAVLGVADGVVGWVVWRGKRDGGWMRRRGWVAWVVLVARAGVWAGAGMGLMWLMAQPIERGDWPATDVRFFWGLFAALPTAWWSLDRLGERVGGVSIPLVLTVAGLGTAVGLLAFGSQKFMQMGLAVAGAMAGAVIAGAMTRRVKLAYGAAGVWVVLEFALVMAGLLLARVNEHKWEMMGLLGSPHLAWAAELPGVRRLPRWVKVILRVVVVAAPVGVIAGLAMRRFMAELNAVPGME